MPLLRLTYEGLIPLGISNEAGRQRGAPFGMKSGLSRVKWISENSNEGVFPGAGANRVGSTRHSREQDIVALDGVYAEDKKGYVCFRPAPPPSDAEVARVTDRIHRRIAKLLERRGLGPQADRDESDPLRHSQPLLSELYGASISGRVATGPRAGRRIVKVGDAIDLEDIAVSSGPRCATISGFSVHADVCIPAHDRIRLERICRYAGRPPLATQRLSLLPDGRLLYRLKRRWRDGTSHVIFEPLELIEKLAALVPPPRFNLVRYHGVLAPSAAFRPLVIPESETHAPLPHASCPARKQVFTTDTENVQKKWACRPRNYSWVELMKRVFTS
jgi:hypothetical protein